MEKKRTIILMYRSRSENKSHLCRTENDVSRVWWIRIEKIQYVYFKMIVCSFSMLLRKQFLWRFFFNPKVASGAVWRINILIKFERVIIEWIHYCLLFWLLVTVVFETWSCSRRFQWLNSHLIVASTLIIATREVLKSQCIKLISI